MTCVYHDAKKDGWRLEVWVRGLRRKLWLGQVSKNQAQAIRMHVHSLKVAAETATQPEPSTLLWVKAVDMRIHSQLADWGLVSPRLVSSAIRLREWCDKVLGMEQNVSWSKSTRYSMSSVADLLIERIGDRPIDSITENDAQAFGEYVYSRTSISESHAGKQIKRARQFFNFAIKGRVIDSNPFSAVRVSNVIDDSRKAYIAEDVATKILENCPDQLWRVIFVLARFGGLRVPTEILSLQWSFIDWEKCRAKIVSPKQIRHKSKYVREIPLSPTVIRELEQLRSIAEDGEIFVCNRYRSAKNSTAHFRKPLLNAIQRAGQKQWPKLWVNLRASCRTDWLKIAPVHAVNQWMGHDGKVGEAHYDRVTDADWTRITAPTHAPTIGESTKKRRGNLRCSAPARGGDDE